MYTCVGFTKHPKVDLFLNPVQDYSSEFNFALRDQNTKVAILNNQSYRLIDLEKEEGETMNNPTLHRVGAHTYAFTYKLRRVQNGIMARQIIKIFRDDTSQVTSKELIPPAFYNGIYELAFSGEHVLLYGFQTAHIYSGVNELSDPIEEINTFEFPFRNFSKDSISFSFPYIMVSGNSDTGVVLHTCYASKKLLGQLLCFKIWENTTDEGLRDKISHILNIYELPIPEVVAEFMDPGINVYALNVDDEETKRLITYEQLRELNSIQIANLLRAEIESQVEEVEAYYLYLDGFSPENIHMYISHTWRGYQIFRTAEYLQLTSGIHQANDLVDRIASSFNEVIESNSKEAGLEQLLNKNM